MRTNGERRPEQIQAEIDRTRSDMDATLKAIEQRLTPGQLVDQGLDYLRHSGGREFVANLGGSVKQNPLPVTLVGIGLAWLMAAGKSPRRETYTDPSATEALAERASGTMTQAKEKLGSAKQQLTDTVQSARERASQLSEASREQIRRARTSIDYMIEEQPLALGAIGLAVGAVLAAAAPRTRKEDELMGGVRDRLTDDAKELVATKAKQAAPQPAEVEPLRTPQPVPEMTTVSTTTPSAPLR
jgi:ElaB/YqjD/DUF883 family membrane-anchored ribosome-binding protein